MTPHKLAKVQHSLLVSFFKHKPLNKVTQGLNSLPSTILPARYKDYVELINMLGYTHLNM